MRDWLWSGAVTFGLALALFLACEVRAAESPPVGAAHAPPSLRACRPAGFPTRYDALIRAEWIRRLGARWAHRHCRFRALLARESSLRADAASSAGAVGLGEQLSTAARDCRLAGIHGRRREARFSIACTAYLYRRSLVQLREPRPEDCRLHLAELGYVSGFRHVIRGQRVARREGRPAVCPDDGILDGMREILSPAAYREAAAYSPRIDALEEAMRP